MNNIKIKQFYQLHSEEIERNCNIFLDRHRDFKLHDIKIISNTHNKLFTGLIILERNIGNKVLEY